MAAALAWALAIAAALVAMTWTWTEPVTGGEESESQASLKRIEPK